MNQISPMQSYPSSGEATDRIIHLDERPDEDISGFLGRPNGEQNAVDVYTSDFDSLNAAVRSRATVRQSASRYFLNEAEQRAERVVTASARTSLTETWEDARAMPRYRATMTERFTALFLLLLAGAGISFSVSVLRQYLKSGPITSLVDATDLDLLQYASVIIICCGGIKALSLALSREGQRRLVVTLAVVGVIAAATWIGNFAMLFQPLPETSQAMGAASLMSAAPAIKDNVDLRGILLLAAHLVADVTLGSAAFIAFSIPAAKGRLRHEVQTSADRTMRGLVADARHEVSDRANEHGTDLALAGPDYEAGRRRAEQLGRAHYARLMKQHNAAAALAEFEVARSARRSAASEV